MDKLSLDSKEGELLYRLDKGKSIHIMRDSSSILNGIVGQLKKTFCLL
jgi:hypothetical protein